MSYELSIKGDQEGATTTERQPLIRFLADVVGLLPDSEAHFRIVDAAGVNYGDVDLSPAAEGRGTQGVNCIQVHIPYAYARERRSAALSLCRQIASHLGWLIYDEQEGRYIGRGDH